MKKSITVFLLVMILSLMLPNFVSAADTARVIGDFVSVRKSAGGTVLTKLIYGTSVTILGEEGNYYKINYDGKNVGYMDKQYIKRVSEYTFNDSAYCQEMVNKGFDASYCPYLSYMHRNHPTWTFTPLVTNLDFYKDVVDGEEGKNCIQSTNDAYRSSSKSCDAGGWYFVNQTVNAFMLDPRNFLHEKTIFMFEDLGYTERAENRNIVSTIFGSNSFLNKKKDGNNSYIDYYLDAGKTYRVSPVHLAARTKQEGAADESYGPITGTVKSTLEEYGNRTLYGYYNFYNIGASNGGNPQLKGLAYAAGYQKGTTAIKTTYGRPWNSRKKAIYGGAEFIMGSYIGAGQSTLYLEKFNTNPSSNNPLYTHQYMSNIFAPYSEGTSAKTSYEKSNILDVAYNFVIPVYKNMPTETVQASVLNNNNYLQTITINNQPIDAFEPDITEYKLYYLDTITKFVVDARAQAGGSTVTGNGTYEFKTQENQIIIKVTAENGSIKQYVFHIIRVKDTTTVDEIVGKLGVKVHNYYLYGITSNTAVSTIKQSIAKMSPSAEVTIIDKDGKVKANGNIVTGDKIKIKTLASGEKTFELAINGDVTGDGKIDIKDLLRVQKHLLGTSKLSGIYFYAADTNNDSKLNVQDLLRVQKHILGSIHL